MMAACGGAQYAADKGIPVILFSKTKDEPDALSSDDLVKALRLCSFKTSYFVNFNLASVNGISFVIALHLVPLWY